MKSTFIRSAAVLCALLFFMSFPFSALAADGENYSALFQKAADDPTGAAPALSEAFYGNPTAFIRALALEDTALQDVIGDAIGKYNTGNGTELELLQLILETYASDNLTSSERSTILSILMSFHADVSRASDELLYALLSAMRHSDGIGSDKCGIYLYDLFLSDPVQLVQHMAGQDADFQELLAFTLNYQRDGLSSEEQYVETVRKLSENQDLTEDEKAFAAMLAEKLTPVEPETAVPVETAAPAVSTDAGKTQHNAILIFIGCIAIAAVVIAAVIPGKTQKSSK